MRTAVRTCLFCFFLLGALVASGETLAQTSPITPLQQAEMLDACNGMPVLSAELTNTGQLQVRCGRIANSGSGGSLGAIGGLIAALVLVAALGAAGGDSPSTN